MASSRSGATRPTKSRRFLTFLKQIQRDLETPLNSYIGGEGEVDLCCHCTPDARLDNQLDSGALFEERVSFQGALFEERVSFQDGARRSALRGRWRNCY